MTQKKSMLDILMRDGVEAYIDEVRRQDMREHRQAHLRRVEKGKAEIEAMLADDATAFLVEERNEDLAPQTQAAPSIGEVISKIASAFDDAFYAFLAASGLIAPAALQAQLARSSRSYQEKASTPPGEEILGMEQSQGQPHWMPWPPIKSDKTEGTWHFMIDWYAKGSAPNSLPTVHLRIDGVEVEAPKVSKRTTGPTAKRIGFDVHGFEPVGFELEELKSGDLRFNVLTDRKNLG